jgi:hypothetical protein
MKGLVLPVAIAMAFALAPRAPAAAAEEISIDHRQVAVLLRALNYEQRLKERPGADLHIGVVGKSDGALSEQSARAMSIAFAAAGNANVQGRPLKTTQLGFTGAAAFAELVERGEIDVLYICPGLDAELAGILETTRRLHIVSMGSKQEYVTKGASLGVFPIDGTPTVFVNLAASRKEGAEFATNLLRLARVLR